MSIIRRTVFYEVGSGGEIRFSPMCQIVTTLGTMVEFNNPFARLATETPAINFDPADECCRVDRMEQVDFDQLPTLLSGGGSPAVHGGVPWPIVGR